MIPARKINIFQIPKALFIIWTLLMGADTVAASPEEEIKSRVNSAVDHARKGEFDKSIQAFDGLIKKFPERTEIFTDYIVVLAWSGDCKRASALFEKNFPEGSILAAPYLLKQVAKCYRNLKKFEKSVETYKRALSVTPDDLDALTGLAYAYSENREIQKALELLKLQIEKHPRKRTLKLALAYVYKRDGDYLKAVLLYDKLLEDKKERRLIFARLRALSRLGAHTMAIKGAAEAGVTDPALLGFLRGNFAARLISWNRNIPQAEERSMKWKDLNRAIKILNELLEADRTNKRALFDLMGARVLLGHPRGLLRTYEHLKLKKGEIPNWVREIVADAYRETAQPEPAIEIYKALLRADSKNFYWWKKLYFAYVLKNDLTKASEVLERLLSMESSPTRLFDGIVTPNWKKVELETGLAWLTAYKDRLRESEKRFKSLLALAPHNSSIHSGVAHLLLWRGLPESAEREFRWILGYDPTYTAVRTGYAETLMTLMKYSKAEKEVQKLSLVYPVTGQIEKINNRWKSITRPGLSSQGTLIREERGGKDWGADVKFHSGLFKHSYRFDLNYSLRQSVADSGRVDYSRLGVGVRYQRERLLSLTQRFAYDPEEDGDFGGVSSFQFVPNDHLTLSGNYRSFIFDMPLRARISGIEGRSFDLSLRLSTDERMALRVNTSISRYTDTNQRKSYSLSYRQKIVPGYRYRAFAELNGYVETNSFKNAIYFNPARGAAYSLTAVNQFTMVNIFRKRFIQNLNVSVGQYYQSGFSAGITADILYEHRWDISAGREFVYGAHWKRRTYDGKSEQTPGVYANFRYYF